MKAKLILLAIQAGMWAILLGVGLWYLAGAMPGGPGVPYASMPRFLQGIGACDANGVCNIGGANGCFLCPYVKHLFEVIGAATESLWSAIVNNVWILLALGLAVVAFYQAYVVIAAGIKDNAPDSTAERKFDFAKWWEAVKKPFIRVIISAAFLGTMGLGGIKSLQLTSDVVIYPVMLASSALTSAAAGTNIGCEFGESTHPLSAVSDSFSCIVGNLNATILYGANGGFAMMNYAWLGLGGGILTWIGGLAVALIFLYLGFRVLWKILNVVFNLVFIIIFLPLLIAAWAFEASWGVAKGAMSGAIGMLAKTAVRSIGIVLEVVIISGMINFARTETLSSDPVAEIEIAQRCEAMADRGGQIDAAIYKNCFVAERARNPNAFRYLDHGWDFIMMMLFIFAVYYILIDKKLQKIINTDDDGGYFKFGNEVQSFGKQVWGGLNKIVKRIPIGKK
jgi:hypothetical protein